MAVTIHTGELRHKVVFKQPTSSLNNEGGREVSYEDGIETWAAVRAFNQFRATEANVTSLIGSLDFFIRFSQDRQLIDKDWLIEYQGSDYVIHEIERINQRETWLRFTAKSKGNTVVSENSQSDDTGGSGGGGSEDVDTSHISLSFEVDAELGITLAATLTSPHISFIDWGDGTNVTTANGTSISESKTYASPGTYEVKLYPVSGVTDPTSDMVNAVQELSILKTSGDGVLTIGSSLSDAGYLRRLEANDMGITDLPTLPNSGEDQVRFVSVFDNDLNGPQCSALLVSLDNIGWPVGYVDISGNPGAASLSAAGLIAKQSLENKGWTVNV